MAQPPTPPTPEQRARAAEARRAKVAAWEPVRQPRGDDREALKAYVHGLQIPEAEPVTIRRLRLLLRRSGVFEADVQRACACSMSALVALNPGIALWGLVATTIETIRS